MFYVTTSKTRFGFQFGVARSIEVTLLLVVTYRT